MFFSLSAAIDYVTNTVFWADAKLDYIAMADLNLQHRRRIMQNDRQRPNHLHHVFALSVFEDYLFWTDWETKQIHKANKFSGMDLTDVHEATAHRPMDIQVFHPYRQSPRKLPFRSLGNLSWYLPSYFSIFSLL